MRGSTPLPPVWVALRVAERVAERVWVRVCVALAVGVAERVAVAVEVGGGGGGGKGDVVFTRGGCFACGISRSDMIANPKQRNSLEPKKRSL